MSFFEYFHFINKDMKLMARHFHQEFIHFLLLSASSTVSTQSSSRNGKLFLKAGRTLVDSKKSRTFSLPLKWAHILSATALVVSPRLSCRFVREEATPVSVLSAAPVLRGSSSQLATYFLAFSLTACTARPISENGTSPRTPKRERRQIDN